MIFLERSLVDLSLMDVNIGRRGCGSSQEGKFFRGWKWKFVDGVWFFPF